MPSHPRGEINTFKTNHAANNTKYKAFGIFCAVSRYDEATAD
jgi:hypothetical protein